MAFRSSLFFILILFLGGIAFAQTVTPSFDCNDPAAANNFDLQIYSRSTGEYEPESEWSEKLAPNSLVKKRVQLEGDYQYVFLLSAENRVNGVGLEILDDMGGKIEYDYKLNEPDNNELVVFFTPENDGVYYLLFRVIGKDDQPVCTYMGVLKGEPDDEENP